ncbi:MAG: WapI family immunity protein [Cellulophaga sp.]
MEFIEPNLAFELINTGVDFNTIRIKFDLESKPQNADDEKDYFVDCNFNNSELNKIIEGLKKELKPYLKRAVK